MKKLQVNPCVKCGEESPDIRSEAEVLEMTGCKTITFLGMTATCVRCGWIWEVKPLDERGNK